MKNCVFKPHQDGFKCENCGFYIKTQSDKPIMRNCVKVPQQIKEPIDKHDFVKDIKQAAKDIVAHDTVQEEQKNERLEICKTCEFFVKNMCKKCGCFMPLKVRLANSKCPINKW